MPYIPAEEKADMDSGLIPVTAGQLSYKITRLVQAFIGQQPKYYGLALAVGVLVLTTFEFIWRVVRPYEDAKREENGDVFKS